MSGPVRSLSFLPAAERDAEGARNWYAQRSGLAARAFITELIHAVEAIREFPLRSPQYLAGTRRFNFPTFPFSLVYRVVDDTIVIVAVAHHRRKPEYWLERR